MIAVMVRWSELVTEAPELAAFGAERLTGAPAYLATVRRSGDARLHPVTPILTTEGLYLFMEPTSPKGRDLRERRGFVLHNGVADDQGSGGEFYVRGEAVPIEDAAVRDVVAEAASYDPEDRYVLFELLVTEAVANGYGDVTLPEPKRWPAPG